MWVEIKPINNTEGIIVNGESCSSCWQGHSPIAVGTQVILPKGFDWELASKENPDYWEPRDVSNNERTMVMPEELIIVSDSEEKLK
jgi:hypothetical protein